MNISETKLFFTRRRIQKQARHLLKSARHFRSLREDVAVPGDLNRLAEMTGRLSDNLRLKDLQAIEQDSSRLAEVIEKIHPPRSHSFLRENIEVIAVALAVAMAFRTYFIQPFKIPTSSMYPTLAGIHYVEKERKTPGDYFPLNLLTWAVFGQQYVEVKAQASGLVNILKTQEGALVVDIAGIKHKIEPHMSLRVASNEPVLRGQTLASGMKVVGDHIFVNRLKWNFVKPARGEIMVFKTDGISPQLRPNEHYVKRMVGLPGETVGIETPLIYINGKPVTGIGMMDKIQACVPGYNGYIQAGNFMAGGVNPVKLGEDQYFACGDNQRNSLDSRYWGAVPRKNLVGPAFFIYWPLSPNWGPVR